MIDSILIASLIFGTRLFWDGFLFLGESSSEDETSFSFSVRFLFTYILQNCTFDMFSSTAGLRRYFTVMSSWGRQIPSLPSIFMQPSWRPFSPPGRALGSGNTSRNMVARPPAHSIIPMASKHLWFVTFLASERADFQEEAKSWLWYWTQNQPFLYENGFFKCN